MNRTELLAKVQPLADKLARDITALVAKTYDGQRDRALQLAREALQLELDQEDADGSDDKDAQARPARAPRSPRRKALAARVPRASRAEDDRPRRRRAVVHREDLERAVASSPTPARPKHACKVCGQAGHNARTCPDRVAQVASPEPAHVTPAVTKETEPVRAPVVDLKPPPQSAVRVDQLQAPPQIDSLASSSSPRPGAEPRSSTDGEEGTAVEFLVSDQHRRRVRTRPRRTTPRAKTIALKNITREDLRVGAIMYPPIDIARPSTRGECRVAERPCPWVACRHHLYLDVNEETGSIKINFPDLEPWELRQSCSLDVAEAGASTLEEVGAITNLTRERVRQIEVRGLITLKQGRAMRELAGDEPTTEAA